MTIDFCGFKNRIQERQHFLQTLFCKMFALIEENLNILGCDLIDWCRLQRVPHAPF